MRYTEQNSYSQSQPKNVCLVSSYDDHYGKKFEFSGIGLGFFKSSLPAKMHRHHNRFHAVKKLTRKVKQLGRERVLLWYKTYTIMSQLVLSQ